MEFLHTLYYDDTFILCKNFVLKVEKNCNQISIHPLQLPQKPGEDDLILEDKDVVKHIGYEAIQFLLTACPENTKWKFLIPERFKTPLSKSGYRIGG
jgi:hypothetical protein